jgi:RimJ/RimL family protein N-acetyltransferase
MELRIQLKTPTWEDMQYIRWLWSDPETMEPVGGPVLLSEEQAQRWFEYMIDPGRPTECYRLIINEAGKPIGEVSFHDLDPDAMTAMFNLKIASEDRCKGYGVEAMLFFLDNFFNKLGGKVMLDNFAPDNLRGQEVLLRFGFQRDPTVESGLMFLMTRDQFNRRYANFRA